MNNSELDQFFHEYANPVILRLQSNELLSTFPDCFKLINDRINEIPAWQIALPVICCLAVGGTLDAGYAVASAWYPAYLASEILDNVEDKEFLPDRLVLSPEFAINLSTSLIFLAFHSLTSLPDPEKTSQVVRIFSESGFEATYGQNRDLYKTSVKVEETLNDYWEMIIQKSGSIFHAATAGGAAAGTSDETYIDALSDYGTAIGVLLQLFDDCRDAFSQSQETIKWEISLSLLLYLMAVGVDDIRFPDAGSKAGWGEMLRKVGVINAISSILLEWKIRALDSINPLLNSKAKQILEQIPALILERIPMSPIQVQDGSSS